MRARNSRWNRASLSCGLSRSLALLGLALISGCPADTSTGIDLGPGEAAAGAPGAMGAVGPAGAVGLSCWDLNGNGVGDAGEDSNGDGAFDAADCQGADGASGVPGATGAAGSNATVQAGAGLTESAGVFALDTGFTDNLYWRLGGNSAALAQTLGTLGDAALDLVVNGARALSIQPSAGTPNLVGGFAGNTVTAGAVGVVIGGGGAADNSFGIASQHLVFDDHGVIGGGLRNSVGSDDGDTTAQRLATVGGGEGNIASGANSSIGGGATNRCTAEYTAIAGGAGNNAAGPFAAVGGGMQNVASASGTTVAGGSENVASEQNATVAGGAFNEASGEQATVGGGIRNTASGFRCTIAGGNDNVAGGIQATVGGGDVNTAGGQVATVGGGLLNEAAAYGSTIPGGNRARASHWGEFAYASGSFTDVGDAQTSIYVLRGETSDATPTELFLDGASQRVTIATSRVVAFDVLIAATTSAAGCAAAYRVGGVVKNPAAGVIGFVGGVPATITVAEDVAAWSAAVAVDTTNSALVISVTGAAGANIRWVATVRATEVEFP